MNAWQEAFCAWNAQRLGIGIDVSRARFARSMAAFTPEYGGAAHVVNSVFADDSPGEVFDAYAINAPMHFLRMLSYPECAMSWAGSPVLSLYGPVSILDFGCGLAQFSITLARAFAAQGSKVSLYLADIPTLRAEFLVWMTGATFLPCTRAVPMPPLPRVDVVIATEIFEHLHDPLSVLSALDAALRPGGFLVTAVADHLPEFLHVSPDLSSVRRALGGYDELVPNTLYRKP